MRRVNTHWHRFLFAGTVLVLTGCAGQNLLDRYAIRGRSAVFHSDFYTAKPLVVGDSNSTATRAARFIDDVTNTRLENSPYRGDFSMDLSHGVERAATSELDMYSGSPRNGFADYIITTTIEHMNLEGPEGFYNLRVEGKIEVQELHSKTVVYVLDNTITLPMRSCDGIDTGRWKITRAALDTIPVRQLLRPFHCAIEEAGYRLGMQFADAVEQAGKMR